MSAEIISFPLRQSTATDQQRWIPGPRVRRPQPRSLTGWLRLAGVLSCIAASWFMVLGAAHLIAFVL
ncbi:MAG TPA: hypothetical protein VKQ29_14855 [Aliidongia sp.]|nr:hypothetical protein [Aliidongia sp.]